MATLTVRSGSHSDGILELLSITVSITETSLRQLLEACEEGKKDKEEKTEVKSDYSTILFEISNELKPNTQESIGFKRISKEDRMRDSG